MRVGALCSAGGASFFGAVDLLIRCGTFKKEDFYVVSDRECGAEAAARDRAIQCDRISFSNRTDFSQQAAELFRERETELVLMYFLRIVGPELMDSVFTLNIHPSLLPSFRGFRAIAAAKTAGSKFLGATLHVASAEPDAGQIVAQVVTPLDPCSTQAQLAQVSYLQKTYLTLCAIDLLSSRLLTVGRDRCVNVDSSVRRTASANPALVTPEYVREFAQLQRDVGLEILVP